MRPEPNEIVIRGGDYEHVLAIAGRHDGVPFGYEVMRIHDIFARMHASRPFEVCEFSLANYLTLRATGQDWLTAIPVFPYRAFRHSLAITHRESGITSLGQLTGKRIGVEDYSMTAAVWFRALLREEYGVDHRSIRWVTGPKQRFPFPAGATVETSEADLEQLLCERAIDALLAFSPRDARLPPEERRLRPVLSDAQTDEQAYFQKTGVYPIHHCVVLRNDVIERRPELIDIVYNAYEAAKAQAYKRKLGTTLVPWGGAHWVRTFERFGGDPLPYGWTSANRLVVDRLARNLHEQGFIGSVPDVDRLFARPAIAA
jgi:4,5-dihydroxyphthalate decarboxylase